MTKYSILAVLVLTATVACGPKKKEVQKEPTLRSKAEKTACPLDTKTLFEKPKDSTLVRTLVDRKDLAGEYNVSEVEVFQYVNGPGEFSEKVDGSVRMKFKVQKENTEVADSRGEEICDSDGYSDQTKPSQTPAPEKLVIARADGASQFNLPSGNVTEKFDVHGNTFEKQALSPSAIEKLRDSGDYRNVPGEFTSIQTFTLKEGGIVQVTYVETKTSITVTRVTYSKVPTPEQPATETPAETQPEGQQ